MKKVKYKILVLSDLKKSTNTILKSTVSLAKMIDGDIEFFHVKKPTEIIERESQLSAMRSLNKEHNTTDKKIQKLIKAISKDYEMQINYKFSFGHVKNEIEKCIDSYKPDIIVLGKRQSKSFSFIGDNMVNFVLNKHKGVIMVAAEENALEPNKEISIGVLNGIEQLLNLEFADELMGHTQKPLKSFKIVNNSKTLKEPQEPADKNTIEYVFEQGDNAIKNLSNYLSKNNINLFCVDRGSKTNLIKSDLKDVINNLNVSLLLTGSQ